MDMSTRNSILKQLGKRVSAAAHFYHEQAKRCNQAATGAYLLFLDAKKRNQLVVFKRFVSTLFHVDTDVWDECNSRELAKYNTSLDEEKLSEIHEFAIRSSENDISVMSSFLSLVEEEIVAKAVAALIDLERDFALDARTGYLKFMSHMVTDKPFALSSDMYQSTGSESRATVEKSSDIPEANFTLGSLSPVMR